jgi:hypothetical protein
MSDKTGEVEHAVDRYPWLQELLQQLCTAKASLRALLSNPDSSPAWSGEVSGQRRRLIAIESAIDMLRGELRAVLGGPEETG